ncbi:RPA-related protein RADX-like isoform X2 [Hypanus sabinus]|uniref:RPA-related protein RADX-like isoform X2 n=1 Tax=Hypanus sabinus TaxID=79690 RepID=UPI0028C3AA02|nr:RPA-related protein RADX-like isoform X2 [Hypanus sabinus]
MTKQQGTQAALTRTKMAEDGLSSGCFGPMLRDLTVDTACRLLACAGPIAVLSVERYRRDPGSGGSLLEGAGPDMYDVSLSDGHYRLRATLRPALNYLVRSNQLHSGCELRGLRFAVEYDERRAGAGGRNFVVMEAQVIVAANGAPSPLVKGECFTQLPVLGEGGERRAGPEMPLKARRRCYLPLWDSLDYYGDVWHLRPADHPVETSQRRRVTGSGSIFLSQLEESILQKRKGNPPVVIRILRKCRLYHFGQPDRYAECPFQAKFLAADKSGLVTLVLWNSLCMDWYRYLEPGMVIQLHNYVVKKSYATRMGLDPGASKEPALELNLNPRNPAAEITVVSAGSVSEEWQLPPLQYSFATRKELSNLRPGDQCDIIGLVTFVGRQERIRSKEHADEFLVYRWVHLIDGTACEPFVLKLFSTCQPEIQTKVYPCSILDNAVTFLVCTNVRVESKVTDPNGPTTFPYLLTTEYTQVYVNGYHQGKPYVKNPKVKEFIQWVQTAKDKYRERLSHSRIGGYYTFPPLPCSERDYRQEVLGGSALTTMSELKQLLDQLEYREYRRVTVQGHISSVKYKPLNAEDGEEVLVFNPDETSSTKERAYTGNSVKGNLSFQSTGRSHSPVIPVIRTSQRKRVASPLRKRKTRKGVTRRKRQARPRLVKGTESSSEEEPASLTHTGVKITEGHVSSDQGLNRELSLDAVFLATVPGLDHQDMCSAKHDKTLISALAHGGIPSGCIDSDSEVSFSQPPGDILRPAAGLEKMLFIFVLDICSQGGVRVEVALNRAYVQHHAL